jgi:hypothetical protein
MINDAFLSSQSRYQKPAGTPGLKSGFTLETKGFFGQIIGPIFLICALFLTGKLTSVINYDLALVSIVGLILCARWHLKGFLYAISLLLFSIVGKHLLIRDHHVWQAGFELSVALAFFTTAMIFQEDATAIDALSATSEAQRQTIMYLEEDLAKIKESSSNDALIFSEKSIELRSQLEEALSESSAYQILNDVLRKATAKTLDEKVLLSSQFQHSERRSGHLLSEIDSLQKELARIGNESFIVQQNAQLFKELNEVRMKEAQTHLVNETLVRMHRNESLKVRHLETVQDEAQTNLKTATDKLIELQKKVEDLELSAVLLDESSLFKETIQKLEEDLSTKQMLSESMHEKTAQLSEAIERLKVELSEKEQQLIAQQASLEATGSHLGATELALADLNGQISQLQLELASKAALEVNLKAMQEKIAEMEAQPKVIEIDQSLQEQVVFLEKRLSQYGKMELLYLQLKGNFDQKNEILHQTRVELFKTDTELQTLKKEADQESLNAEPFSPTLVAQIDELESENETLSLENQLLQDLVSHLMNTVEESPLDVKKRKRSMIAVQQDLFNQDPEFKLPSHPLLFQKRRGNRSVEKAD